MKRLTVNKNVSEMGMVELAHNSCFAKNKNAAYRDFESEIDARDFIRKIGLTFGIFEDDCEELTDDEAFDEVMADYLQYGYDEKEGLLALLYRNLWAQADLYERLKHYEDLEEQGLLLKLTCKKGDTLFYPYIESINGEKVISKEEVTEIGLYYRTGNGNLSSFSEVGSIIFLTQAEAEEALKRMEGENEAD